jgi:hypothetical protein
MTLYLAYLLIAGGIFFRMTRKPNTGKPNHSHSSDSNTLASHA